MLRQTPMMAMPGRISYHIAPVLPPRPPPPPLSVRLRALPARPAPGAADLPAARGTPEVVVFHSARGAPEVVAFQAARGWRGLGRGRGWRPAEAQPREARGQWARWGARRCPAARDEGGQGERQAQGAARGPYRAGSRLGGGGRLGREDRRRRRRARAAGAAQGQEGDAEQGAARPERGLARRRGWLGPPRGAVGRGMGRGGEREGGGRPEALVVTPGRAAGGDPAAAAQPHPGAAGGAPAALARARLLRVLRQRLQVGPRPLLPASRPARPPLTASPRSLYPHVFSRAYINFRNQEDIVLFRDRFDGYVFVDHKGRWSRDWAGGWREACGPFLPVGSVVNVVEDIQTKIAPCTE